MKICLFSWFVKSQINRFNYNMNVLLNGGPKESGIAFKFRKKEFQKVVVF